MIFALARLTKRNETISMREGKCVYVCVRVCGSVPARQKGGDQVK